MHYSILCYKVTKSSTNKDDDDDDTFFRLIKKKIFLLLLLNRIGVAFFSTVNFVLILKEKSVKYPNTKYPLQKSPNINHVPLTFAFSSSPSRIQQQQQKKKALTDGVDNLIGLDQLIG